MLARYYIQYTYTLSVATRLLSYQETWLGACSGPSQRDNFPFGKGSCAEGKLLYPDWHFVRHFQQEPGGRVTSQVMLAWFFPWHLCACVFSTMAQFLDDGGVRRHAGCLPLPWQMRAMRTLTNKPPVVNEELRSLPPLPATQNLKMRPPKKKAPLNI